MLDRAGSLVESDRIAAAAGPIEDDRKGGEQTGEDALRGQADGDSANAKPSAEAGVVYAEIVEDGDDRDREQLERNGQTASADSGPHRDAYLHFPDPAMNT